MKDRIVIRELSFKYEHEGPPILSGLSMTAGPGKIIGITGLSGCGKSTFGCCVAGVIPKLLKGEMSGTIELDGKAGIVFQDPDSQIFLPTVEDEIAFGPENLCLPKEEIDARIEELLSLTGMSELRRSNPARLSGGEKQLIVFAAVLSMDPDIIVCDEVMAALDESGKERIRSILLTLRLLGKTILLIEHDMASLSIADECWQLLDGKLLKQNAVNFIGNP